jgi:hypothetical protein
MRTIKTDSKRAPFYNAFIRTFHIVSAFATAAVLSSIQKSKTSRQQSNANNPYLLGTGFVAGILLHGLLDFAPHSYPGKNEVANSSISSDCSSSL